MPVVFYNNEYLDGSVPYLNGEDRSFRYGDGLFESMAAFDGVVPLLPYHYERLQHSCEILQMEPPAWFKFDRLKETVTTLLQKNGCRNARLRMQATRAEGGLYLPISNDVNILITCTGTNHDIYGWSSLKVDFSPYRVDMGILSNLKTTSKIAYVMSALHAQRIGAQECFMFNVKGTLAEAINSNVFIIKGDLIVTPALTNGGVDGVMRRYVLSQMEKTHRIVQSDILMKDIDEADEMFLTNAVKGIQSVAVIGSVVYSDQKTREIFKQVNDSIKAIISASK